MTLTLCVGLITPTSWNGKLMVVVGEELTTPC